MDQCEIRKMIRKDMKMNQKKMSAMLKGIAIVAGMMLTVFLMIVMPMFAKECRAIYPKSKELYIPGLCYGWYLGILCYIALFQFAKICIQIGNDNSFSKENMKSLNIIGIIGMMAALSWFVIMITLVVIGSMSVAFFVMIVLAVMISISLSILATVLSHLVRKAYELKEENELTI